VIDWFNDNEGFAIVLLTAALVIVTIWYAVTTSRALAARREARGERSRTTDA
jgi:hypothetical protein